VHADGEGDGVAAGDVPGDRGELARAAVVDEDVVAVQATRARFATEPS
jgi:hypothetical protein